MATFVYQEDIALNHSQLMA